MTFIPRSIPYFAARNLLVLLTLAGLGACGGNDGTEADRLGVGAQCAKTDDCQDGQTCLTQFKGGYCGISGCTKDADCPATSACVAHDDGMKYCFRTCAEKIECNENRTLELESNCSSSATLVETQKSPTKVCLPPSGK
ncbi:MAG: hypothetical protein SGI86_13115 [Deltaproteobacteria bacterium]|nr:hypothetical protein [Deltaproteobacteria bacterium]